MKNRILACCLCAAISPLICAQSRDKTTQTTLKQVKQLSSGHLFPAETVIAKSEVAVGFDYPLTCDADGNLYLKSTSSGVSGIRKLNTKGERIALFQPSRNPDLKIDAAGYFSIAQDGDLYQLIFPHELTRYVMVFGPDGNYKSSIKLQPGFAWIPSTMAVFPSGNLLISGLEYDQEKKSTMRPFTGIFGAGGALLKEIRLEDDDALRDLAASGDARVTSPTNPSANHAVEFGQMSFASDGNIYLMRWITPTIFYAISPGGEVVRRFTVDPGDPDYRPAEMHISGSRIAVLFFQPQTLDKRIIIVDLEGREIGSYDELRQNGQPKYGVLGTAFACYTENPTRFTFLTTAENNSLSLRFVEVR